MYCKVENGTAIEHTLGQLRAQNRNVSFPTQPSDESLAEYGVYPVSRTVKPGIDVAQKITGYTITGSGSDWTQSWTVENKTPEELEADQKASDRQADIQALKADPQVLALLKARPGQINNYIENNVSDLDTAKEVLKIYGRALAVLAHTVVN